MSRVSCSWALNAADRRRKRKDASRARRGGRGSRSEAWGFFRPKGAQANKLLIHRLIRVGVATGHQFPVQQSDSVAACFPPFAEKGEGRIKMRPSRTRLLFGKRATAQAARDRGMADPNLVGDGRLREAELVQCHDLMVESKTLLSPGLLLVCFLWTQVGWPSGMSCYKRRGRGFLGQTIAMSGQMTCQHSLQSLSQIFADLESIRTLRGLGSTSSRSRGRCSSPISTHDFHFGMLSHPSCGGLFGPIGKKIKEVVGGSVYQNGAEFPSTPEARARLFPTQKPGMMTVTEGHDAAKRRCW